MSSPVRTEFSKLCDKGRVLYDLICAGCHTIKKGRGQIISDFTPEQLKRYELRVSNARHKANMPDEKVTAEDSVLYQPFYYIKRKINSATHHLSIITYK
ncbi:hypothetical protein A3860_07775 [Niastella vici]|uniref:Cytochrome c domain-containing protein n=1 Tax=Niastella vici TaxID=1703345 RepID=A0A1V9FIM3_9BACT|nr:hypothetical protein [Niastella vici]OQP58214.1 hypothetical protein A3860_07775 [Niastella vici]